jgi:hypothetical protein
MPRAIEKIVDIELFIDDHRVHLLKMITQGNINPSPCTPAKSSSSGVVGPVNSIPVGENNLSPFTVTSSSWNKSESKRVFEVEHLSTKYYYYAFMIRDYIVCPAFLARSLEIANYAFLNVIYGTNYFYIFVNVESIDPKLYIAGNQFNFCGEHVLDLSSKEGRILNLSFENVNNRCFMLYGGSCDALGMEWVEVSERINSKGNTGNNPIKSAVNSLYFYIPKKRFDKFKKNHEAFVKSVPLHNSCALMLEESRTFSEIKELSSRTNSPTNDSEFPNPTLVKIFGINPYKREDYILNKFVDHIKRNYELSKIQKLSQYYCSIITILQSSGYGKSKLMERLGSKTPTFYSSLQYGKGAPVKSFFLVRLIKKFDFLILRSKDSWFYMNNFSTAVYIYILRIIYIILNSTEDTTLKENFQIDSIENCKEFSHIRDNGLEKKETIFRFLFKGLQALCESEERIKFDGINGLTLSNSLAKHHTHLKRFSLNSHSIVDLEQAVMRKLEAMGDINLPSIFVIDEAKGLHYRKSGKKYGWNFMDWDIEEDKRVDVENRAPYNIFRRVFRMFEYTWVRLMLIVISTYGQISVLLPELELDPSRRQTAANKFIENFSLIQTYNVNSDLALTITANKIKNDKSKDDKTDVETKDDENNVETNDDKSNVEAKDDKTDVEIKDIKNDDKIEKDSLPNWNEFIKSKERKEEFFKLGRPLIYATYVYNMKDFPVYNLEAPFQDCLEFKALMDKLFGGRTEYSLTQNVAQLYSMFNFAFGTNFLPSHVRIEDLIENYLMTLIGYLDEDGAKHIIATFLPEGAFNFLSAKYFVDFPDSLIKVFTLSVRYGFCNVGQFGKLLAQYTLLHTAFYHIDPNKLMVRKLVFESIDLEEFLFALAGYNETMIEGFFDLNPELEDSRISFSYFEHFPNNPINKPYDLMARCVLKGSAVTLDCLFPGIDLMIPLILNDGRLSFLGIQVKFYEQSGVNDAVTEAVKKMTFTNMFRKEIEIRPFGLIILALGDYNFEGEKKLEVSLRREAESSLESPTILVFKGMPKILQDTTLRTLFDLAPKYFSYRGVCSDHMLACDHLFGLINELPLSKEAIEALAKYVPKAYSQVRAIEIKKSKNGKREPRISKASKSSEIIASEVAIQNPVASSSNERMDIDTSSSEKPAKRRKRTSMVKGIDEEK